MLYKDYEWEWKPPKREGLYLVWRGDVETPENHRGLIQIHVHKREGQPDKIYWTSTDPNRNDTIGDFLDWPSHYKIARIGE